VKAGLEGFAGGATAGLVEGLTLVAGGRFWACRLAEAKRAEAQSRRAGASRLMRRIVRLSGLG
jgi:hypothetical protein